MTKEEDDSIGAIYLAFGYDYIIQTVRSACSLKAIHPELSIAIVTNIPINRSIGRTVTYKGIEVGPEIFDEIIHINDKTSANRQYKTAIGKYSPYDQTVFLDCDTIIKQEIIQGFDILNYSDLAAVARPIPSRAMSERWNGDINVAGVDIEDSSTFYGGVFFFNTDTAAPFFDSWQRSFNDFGYDHDQYSFTHTIYTTNVTVLPLPIIWNVMDKDIDRYTDFDKGYDFGERIKIHHQNFLTYSRKEILRTLEEAIGDNLLAVDEERHSKIRDGFLKQDGRWNGVKTELAKYRPIRAVYSKVTSLL